MLNMRKAGWLFFRHKKDLTIQKKQHAVKQKALRSYILQAGLLVNSSSKSNS